MASLAQHMLCTGRVLTTTRKTTSSQRASRNAKLAIRAQHENAEQSPELSLPRRAAMQSAVIASTAAAMTLFPEPSLATPRRKKVEKVSLNPERTTTTGDLNATST